MTITHRKLIQGFLPLKVNGSELKTEKNRSISHKYKTKKDYDKDQRCLIFVFILKEH